MIASVKTGKLALTSCVRAAQVPAGGTVFRVGAPSERRVCFFITKTQVLRERMRRSRGKSFVPYAALSDGRMEVGMNINWFRNPDHVVYTTVEQFADNFGKETGIDDLKGEIERFRLDPEEVEKNLKGKRRTSLKLFRPNRVFDEQLDMGDEVWVYLGENYQSYCIYWPE